MLTCAKGGWPVIGFLRVSIGQGGDVACSRCGPTGPQTPFPAAAVLDSVCADAPSHSGGRARNVLLEGMEPFRHPELPEIILGLAEAGVERIGLLTDAAGLGVSENAVGALDAGLRHLHVPLLGPDAASHDPLVTSAGFDATARGIGRFLEAARAADAAVAVVGVVPLCVHNLDLAAATVAAFARLGAVAVRVTFNEGVDPSCDEVRAACETGMVNGVWVWLDCPDVEAGQLADHTAGPLVLSGGAR